MAQLLLMPAIRLGCACMQLSEYGNGNAENVTNLTVWGWLFTIVFTYSGFICLFVGECRPVAAALIAAACLCITPFTSLLCVFARAAAGPGVMWNASILTKLKVIRQRWRDVRGDLVIA